jgi:hypothetical protein
MIIILFSFLFSFRLYGGYPLEYNREKISLNKRYKFQVLNKNRIFASSQHIFLMAKNSLTMKLSAAIGTAMRQTNKKYTVRDVLSEKNMKTLCENDIAYRFVRQIPLVPSYLENKRKDVMAFLRQLGTPSLFMTLSPAEYYWGLLLQDLYRLKHGKEISEEDALNLSEADKHELILSDPAVCCIYFHRRLRQVFNLIKQANNKVFGENYVTDSYLRIEYQQRGEKIILLFHMFFFNNFFIT